LPFRLELRASRWPQAMLIALAALAPLSLWLSALPAGLRVPGMVLSAIAALWAARRESRRPLRLLELAADGEARVDGQPAQALAAEWRGPLAVLRWRDGQGRVQRFALWPDTLPAPQRRALRLALEAQTRTGRERASVAP
jgi:toxin CptA